MPQLENIEAIEKRLWSAADTLRANSNYASNQYFMPVMGLVFLRHAYSRYLAVKDEIIASLPTRGGKTPELTKKDFSKKSAMVSIINNTQQKTKGVPQRWLIKKFNEVAQLSKLTFNPKKEQGSNEWAYLGLEHFDQGGFSLNGIGKIHDITSNKYKFTSGDILFGKLRPYFKKLYRPNFDGICSTDIWVLKPKNNIDVEYLYYLVATNRFLNSAVESSKGTKMPRASWDFVSETTYSIAPATEQKRIASILSSIDKKIELNRKNSQTLEELGRALFKNWFVNFEFPNTEGKPYQSSGGEMVDSKLGNIPKGWSVGVLNDFIGQLESGNRPKGGVSKYKEGVPSIGAENINGLYLSDFNNPKLIPEKFFNSMKRGVVMDLDILVYKDGGTPGVFKPKFSIVGLGYPFDKMAINEHVFRVQGKSIDKHTYLYFWMDGYYCREQLGVIGIKAAVPGINSNDFRKLDILVPPQELLMSFNSIAVQIITTILKNNRQSLTLQKIRNSLLPRLMSGRLRVN